MTFSPVLSPERDSAFAPGHPAGATNFYTLPGVGQVSSTTLTWNGNGELRYYPHFVSAPIVVDQFAAEVTTLQAATNFRIGLYRADRQWQPVGAPLFDSGSISSASTGVKTYTPGSPVYLPRGRWLTCTQSDNGSVVMRSYRSGGPFSGPAIGTSMGSGFGVNWTVNGTYGTLPTPGTAWTSITQTSGGFDYCVVWRVTAP